MTASDPSPINPCAIVRVRMKSHKQKHESADYCMGAPNLSSIWSLFIRFRGREHAMSGLGLARQRVLDGG